MNCIKCGREIPEGELFCEVCAMPSAAPVAEAPEPKREKMPKKKRVKKPVDRKTVRRLRTALVISIILTLAVCALAAYGFRLYVERTEELRIREASVTLREKEADNRDRQITELKQELREAEQTIRSLEEDLERVQAEAEAAAKE